MMGSYAWLMAPHEYEPDYGAYCRDMDSLEDAIANVATYDDWFPDQQVPSPIVAQQQCGEDFRQLLLIKHLAESMTDRNWNDYRLHIIRAAERGLAAA